MLLKVIKLVFLWVIIVLAVFLMIWAISHLIDLLARHHKDRDSLQTTTSILVALLSNIHTYIAAALSVFFASVIRFYTILLCQFMHSYFKTKKDSKDNIYD